MHPFAMAVPYDARLVGTTYGNFAAADFSRDVIEDLKFHCPTRDRGVENEPTELVATFCTLVPARCETKCFSRSRTLVIRWMAREVDSLDLGVVSLERLGGNRVIRFSYYDYC